MALLLDEAAAWLPLWLCSLRVIDCRFFGDTLPCAHGPEGGWIVRILGHPGDASRAPSLRSAVWSSTLTPKRFSVVAAIVLAAAGLCFGALRIHEFIMEPRAERVYPFADEVGVEPDTAITLHFNKAMAPATILPATFVLRDEHGLAIAGKIAYDDAAHTAVLQPNSPLRAGATYEVMLKGNSQGILDRYHHPLAKDKTWRFTIGVHASGTMADGPGGPILVIASKTNGFSQYYAEILRNEGFNEFDVKDLNQISASELTKYDLALVGEVPVDAGQARMLADWVRGGGDLIAMRPSANLAESLGWKLSTTAADGPVQHGGYLRIDSKSPAGAGLFQQPMQFHGDASRFVADGATTLAALYSDDKTATGFPVVSSMQVGGGKAVVFSYDLARSVVYTRQGNPEWSGEERDGMTPIRSDDLFYGASKKDPQPDWVDPKLIAVPQADIQQRLLANLIILSNAKQPLPRFWYLPRGLKAAIVMTGDDHGHGGTVPRFFRYERDSAKGCSLENWECIRGTSNIFVGSISPAQATYFASRGFEIDLHVYTACTNWPTKLVTDRLGVERPQINREFEDALYSQQLEGFALKYPDLPAPISNRTDCITWGDYDTQPQVELDHKIRLDTNYYYWPAKWVKDRPGLFTGSGLPMRFATRDGDLIDVYQAATQMTDESGQSYPFTVNTLLANALGRREYFGVFTANMHNDDETSTGANAIIASAKRHHVPVITAAQLLRWLDGRNASAFRNLKWSGNELSFSIDAGIGANGLEAMLPSHAASGDLISITRDGAALPWQTRTVAGLSYGVVRAAPGTFRATYGAPKTASVPGRP